MARTVTTARAARTLFLLSAASCFCVRGPRVEGNQKEDGAITAWRTRHALNLPERLDLPFNHPCRP